MIQLRTIEQADPQEIQEMANNKAVAINLRDAFPHPYTLADANFFLELCSNGALGKVFALYADEVFVGVGSLIPQTGEHRINAEIGYWLGEAYWGKGYATEAVKQLVAFAFNDLGLTRVYAYIFSFNTASMRVLEKCGFQAEAVLKDSIIKEGIIYDEHLYSIRKR